MRFFASFALSFVAKISNINFNSSIRKTVLVISIRLEVTRKEIVISFNGYPLKIEMSSFEEQKEILGMLERNMITSLWHFTDIGNLPNIKKLNGLRSKEYLEQNEHWGGRDIFPGGDDLSHSLDRNLGNWDKISLNFMHHTPIAYKKKREKHLVFIEIDP